MCGFMGFTGYKEMHDRPNIFKKLILPPYVQGYPLTITYSCFIIRQTTENCLKYRRALVASN